MKWINKGRNFSFFLLAVIVPLLIVRCSPEKQFQTLSFFFDGVPDPNNPTENSDELALDTIITSFTKSEPITFVHQPYEENKCESCHERGFSNSLIIPMPGLCYTCHDDFNAKYKSLHAPVATGYCTACHNQHSADFDKLLMRKNQDICLYCHESKQVFANNKHKDVGDKNCTECHNPHGGENKSLLTAGSCFKCHDNFTSGYAFLHGPVASGYCASCHGQHTSKTKNLLLRESQQLCLLCHDATTIFKNEAHKKDKKNNCTECHNPHGGQDRFFLTKLLQQPIEQQPNKNINQTENDSLIHIEPKLDEGQDSTLQDNKVPGNEKIDDNNK